MELKRNDEIVKVSIEESLSDLVSGFGKYQVWQCFLALVPIVCTAMSNTNFVFAAAAVDYRCVIPGCEEPNATSAVPNWWTSNATNLHCSRPVWNNRTCDIDGIDDFKYCDEWIYETKDSIVAEFDLACKEWKRTLVGTVHNLGVLISMPVMGFVSDRWGRRVAIITSGLSLGLGAFKTLSGLGPTGYITYVSIEFFEAILVTGTYTTCFVLIVELIGSNKRIIGAAAVGISVAIGELLLDFIVWNIPYWRNFLLIIYCPVPIFLLYNHLLEESMRWLLTNGRNEEALLLLQKIANFNQFAVSDKTIDEVNKESKEANNNISREKFNINLLFSSKALLKRVVICSWWWFTAAFVYYGLMISSVALPGNKNTNFALSSFATIPGDIIAVVTLEKVGRKKTLLVGFLFCGICCVASGFIQDYQIASIAIFLIGKTSISACFNAVYVYTSELVPTSARGSLVGTCSMLARVGSVLAPLTPLLRVWWQALPTVLFGCASLSAAVLTLATPETRRRPLPDTVAEATALS